MSDKQFVESVTKFRTTDEKDKRIAELEAECEKLRACRDMEIAAGDSWKKQCQEAEDERDALRAENERLRDECVELNARREALALRVLDAEQKRDASLKAVPEGVEVAARVHVGDEDPETGVNDSLEILPEDVPLQDGDALMLVAQHNARMAEKDAQIEALRQPVAGERCEYCDGTGDVHSLDGEWRGECICMKEHRERVAAGDLLAIAEEVGGQRIAPNVAQVTREDLARLIQFVRSQQADAQPERRALEDALKGMIAIHEEPSGFAGKYGRVLDDAIAAQKVKIDQRIAAARAALSAPAAGQDVSALVELIEPAMHWAGSFRDAWPEDAEHPDGPWVVGAISDGEKYPVLTIDAYQYDADGDSEKIALATIKLWSAALAAHKAGGGQ